MIPTSYRDMTDNCPDDSKYLINISYKHTRNGKRYMATGFVWMGDLDLWGVVHHAVDDKDGTQFVRSIANFKGKHLDGKPRFTDAQVPS